MREIGILCLIVIGLMAFVLYRRRLYIWLPDYLYRKWLRRERVPPGIPCHVLFLFVDHFEPHVGQVDDDTAIRRLEEWIEHYPRLAARHRDADGYPPKHTFFYPYDELSEKELGKLASLCAGGWGEIELQLHHRDDTPETLSAKLQDAIRIFSQYGALVSSLSGHPAFGFIHGNWALDNGRQEGERNFCGVNNELTLLREAGCFADFTMPSQGLAQTRKVNSIYYAIDDPKRPKSHDTGTDARVGQKASDRAFLLVQGPLGFNWRQRRFGILPAIEDSSITQINPPTPDRIDLWVKTGIHVRGRPEWIFVKVHTHGTSPADLPAVLGEPADALYTCLETRYNDGTRYCLHYVTAREVYNIIRAAEAGKTGNPNQYRNFVIPPYRYQQSAS